MIDESRLGFDLDERFEKALRKVATAWRLDHRLRRLGVSRLSWMTIAAAMQARSPLSQSTLADALAISPTSMVQAIDCMAMVELEKLIDLTELLEKLRTRCDFHGGVDQRLLPALSWV